MRTLPVSLFVCTAGALAATSPAPLTIDYPSPFTLCQRGDANSGRIPVRGRLGSSGEGVRLEARFQDSEWQQLQADVKRAHFSGSIQGAVGQGILAVRVVGRPETGVSVQPVSLGDLFVVTGQSNADGRGSVHASLSPDAPFLGVKYRAGAWSEGGDPSDNSGKHASPWPIVLNTLIAEQRVPIGFIQAYLQERRRST